MNITQLRNVLESMTQDIQNLSSSDHKQILTQLLNWIEFCSAEIIRLTQENQNLRDESNRLKGEQGKPPIPPNSPGNTDVSSEKERNQHDPSKPRKQRESRRAQFKNPRREKCQIDPSLLPADAIFKGYEEVLVQDIRIEMDPILFEKEVYYSPSLHQSFMAPLPAGYEGEFGPHLKSLILGLKHICQMSEPKILAFLEDHGVSISASTISRILLNQSWAHEEKMAIFQAGLSSSVQQHIDDTQARVCGNNQHTHVLCNEFYTAYFTTEHKDRLTVLDILRGFKPRIFLFNEEFVELLSILGIAEKWSQLLQLHLNTTPLNQEKAQTLLEDLSSNTKMGDLVKKRILEAAAIAAYHTEADCIQILVCDDAPQFKLLASDLALCWIHEGRHYKKLSPFVPCHQTLLKSFLEDFWSYYRSLLSFQENPTEVRDQELREEFGKLFTRQTGYDHLDDRIKKTFAKSEALLQVLNHPTLPLHNNAAELGARTAVRRRDVSLHTMTKEGTHANDSFMTLTQTAKKLEVSFSQYLYDRLSQQYQMPSLATLIQEKSTVQRALQKQKSQAQTNREEFLPQSKPSNLLKTLRDLPLKFVRTLKQTLQKSFGEFIPVLNTS